MKYANSQKMRNSVQHIPRNQRLSGDDLNRLIRKKLRGVIAKYIFSEGWYIYKGEISVAFIGRNWVEAHNYIHQMPNRVEVIHNLLRRLRGKS